MVTRPDRSCLDDGRPGYRLATTPARPATAKIRSQETGSQAETIRIVGRLTNRTSTEFISTAGTIGAWRSSGRTTINSTAGTTEASVDQWADWGCGWFGWRGRLVFRDIRSVAAWSGDQQTQIQSTGNGCTGRFAHLLAAAALNTHGTNASPGGLCAIAHTQTKPARAGAVVKS